MWAEPSVGDAEAAAGEWQAAFRGQPPMVRDGRETGDVSRVNVDRVVGRLTGYSDRLASVPQWDREAWATAARDTSGALSAWARFDPANAAELRTAASVLSRSATPPRAGQPAASTTSGRSGLAGVALLFAQATRQGRGKDAVAAALFLRQLLRLAESIRAHQVAAANLAEATRIQRDVIDRLQRIHRVRGADTHAARGGGRRQPIGRGDERRPSRPVTGPWAKLGGGAVDNPGAVAAAAQPSAATRAPRQRTRTLRQGRQPCLTKMCSSRHAPRD